MLQKKILGLLLIGGWFGTGLGKEHPLYNSLIVNFPLQNEQPGFVGQFNQTVIVNLPEEDRKKANYVSFPMQDYLNYIDTGVPSQSLMDNKGFPLLQSAINTETHECMSRGWKKYTVFQKVAYYLSYIGIGYFFTIADQTHVNIQKGKLEVSDDAPWGTAENVENLINKTRQSQTWNPHHKKLSWFKSHSWMLLGGVFLGGVWVTAHYKNYEQTGKFIPNLANQTPGAYVGSFLIPFSI